MSQLNLNRVIIAGTLTRDPEIKFLQGDKAVAQFGIAINRRFKDANGEAKEDATFVDIEAWGRTAELAGQYLTKGKGCFIEGRLKLEQWDDKNGGGKRSKLKVVADNIQFTSPREDGEKRTASDPAPDIAPAPRRPAAVAGASAGDDEPPFAICQFQGA